MNVYRCARFKLRNQYCAFLKLSLDKDGKIEEWCARCWLKGRPEDDYRLYPEFEKSTGRIIYNKTNWASPYNFGPNVVWESTTAHEAGWALDLGTKLKGRGIRPEEFNMHPEYTIKNVNEPLLKGISSATTLIPFGHGESLSFSSIGWAEQEIRGLDRVDKCNFAIYGPYDRTEGMVMPKFLKDYCGDIPGWINYTTIPPSKKRAYTFFVANASNKQIVEHCVKWFGKSETAVRIAEMLVAMRQGEYINLWDALENNRVPRRMISAFMRDTNVRTNSLHRDISLQKFWLYYKFLKSLPYEKGFALRCNLLNYLLNDPKLVNMDVDMPDTSFKNGQMAFSPRLRYWWLLLIIKDAWKEGKRKRPLLNSATIPDWVGKMLDAKYAEVEGDEKNPPVISILEVLSDIEEAKPNKSQHWRRRIKIFSLIVRAGQRWTMPEVRSAWIHFCRAYDARSPERFWAWVEAVRLATPDQLNHLLIEPTEITPERAFALHLLESRRDRNSFEVREPKLAARWGEITPKVRRTSEEGVIKGDPQDMFWGELKKAFIRQGKRGEDMFAKFEEQFAQIDPEHAKLLLADFRGEIAEDENLGTVVDKADVGKWVRIVDIDGIEDANESGKEDDDGDRSE